jgi:hypothetical protein
MVRLSKAIPLCLLLVPGCTGDAGRITAPPTGPAFNHVPGEPVGMPSVGVRVDGSMARIIWHEDPFNLGAGYTVELHAGEVCNGTNLVPGATSVAGTAWTEAYHLYMDVGPLETGPYCARVRSNGLYSPPVFQAFVSARFSIGSSNSPPESSFTWTPADPLEGDLVTFVGAASDPDGDELTFAWTLDGVAVSASSSFDQVFGDNGAHEVALTVSDGHGGSSSSAQTVTIANAPPVLLTAAPAKTAKQADASVAVPIGTAVTFSGAFGDPGQLDTHVMTLDCDYGGTPVAGANASAVVPEYSGSCTWDSPGTYRVLITILDDDGGSASRISDPVLVFQAISGLDVTGGGWFDSPVGACQVDAGCAASTGRASFGFVSKYRKGSAVPTGSAQFQLHAGSLTFKAGPQLWLVVDGPVARFAGSGRLDGVAGFDFSVTAVDGHSAREPDRFRIRIWHHASGDVVYDSAPGADPAGDAATPIRGGSIVVHGRD